MHEDITKGRDGAEGWYYKREGWCKGTLQKGARVQKEVIIKDKDDAGGHHKREGWCRRVL